MDLVKMAKKKMTSKAWDMIKKKRNSRKRLERIQIKKQIKKKRRIQRAKVVSVVVTGFLCRNFIKQGLRKANNCIKELVYHNTDPAIEVDSNGTINITQ